MPETRETASAGATARAREYQTMTDPELERLFGYQQISGTQSGHMELIRNQGLRMAKLIRDHCPASRETLEAITELQSTVNWARTAIELYPSGGSTA